MENRIAFIQTWLGPIPEYFGKHLITCSFQKNIDFFIFTDQIVDNISYPNIFIHSITKENIEKRISKSFGENIKLLNNKKSCDLKASFGDMYQDYVKNYEYIGCYDIDTLMGNLYTWLSPYLGEYDFISTGGTNFHNRLSGSFMVWKNQKDLNTFYKKFDFKNIMSDPDIYGLEEKEFSTAALNTYKVKIITHSQNLDENTGRVIYDAEWIGGKTYCDGREIMFHHFYNKPTTKLSFRGNTIISEYKKVYATDFYWVTHFTENYEPLLKVLINSIKNFSNRKCILYTINYTSPLAYKLSDQFIVRRLDIELGELNSKGKYDNVLSLKPSILSDVTDFIPDSKFVYVDTDIALTINADSITKYFDQLENFPLINSHTHDLITVRGIVDGEEWSSPLNILGEATGVPIYVYPRRKTNVIVFDKNCKWFFDEQIELFQQYRGTRQGIFALHDEDSANLLLNKYNYTKCLPLVDMEEIPNIDMEKFHNYSYSAASVSSNLVLPKHENDVLVFHGFKNPDFENRLKDNYYKTVLAQDDYRLFFEKDYNKFWWYKNSNFESKNIKPQVKFEILKDNELLFSFPDKNIFEYWGIFIKCDYPPGIYEMRITEMETERIIHKDLVEV
jgi:hypothetical protein